MQFLTKRNLLPFLALGMVATSCQDEDFGFSQQDVKASAYERAFDETFADVDPRAFQGIQDAELDLEVNIPGDFTLYITKGYITDDPTGNVLFDRANGFKGGGNFYAHNFSYPSDVETVFVSLATENNEIWSQKVAIVDGKCHATFGDVAETRGVTEDWTVQQWLTDSHDFTFMKDGIPVNYVLFSVKHGEAWSQLFSVEYLMAWEDLGGSFDFDFNDLVMKVSRIYEDFDSFKVKVQVLAAGGTMPLAILCTDMLVNSSSFNPADYLLVFNGEQDIHKAWGVSEDTRVNTVLRNDEPNYEELKDLFVMGKKPLETTFEIAQNMLNWGDANRTTLASIMQSFYLIRQKNFDNPASTDNSWDITVNRTSGAVTQNTNDKTNQSIVIADTDWEWPEEHHHILDKYPVLKSWSPSSNSDIWTGKDNESYEEYLPFTDMLNAAYNSIRWSKYGSTRSTFWYTESKGDYRTTVDYIDFTEILDYSKDPQYFTYFTACDWDEQYAAEATQPILWHYDVPFKSKRVLVPYSKVQNYRYRFEGSAPIVNDKGVTEYRPGDECVVIAVVMVNRKHNEFTELELSKCFDGRDRSETMPYDGRTHMGAYRPFEEGKGAVDIAFTEIFLNNTEYEEKNGENWWWNDKDHYGDAFDQMLCDYTKYASVAPGNEEKVFPIDLMISPCKWDPSNNTTYGYFPQQSCEKFPEARFYKIFVGRPSSNSRVHPDKVE